MKKITVIAAVMLCIAVMLTACTGKNVNNGEENNAGTLPENAVNNGAESDIPDDKGENPLPQDTVPTVVNVAALKGPTSIGLVKLMSDAAEDTSAPYAYDFAVEAAADAITPKLIKGEFDMAAVPANLASVLYNNTNGEIVVLNINTLGVLYIVENGDTVKSVEDLRGKTIYSSGKGNTPEYALNYMLQANGLTPGKDVTVEFKSEHSECVAAILAEPNAVAMLPEPFVTTAQLANENIHTVLDLTKEWENASGKTLITGVMVARKSFVEENPEAVADFLAKYENSVDYANRNVAEAALLVDKYGIFTAAVAEKAIPQCSLVFISGDEMKQKLSDYLTELNAQNPAAIGGKLPDDAFYYGTTQE